MSRLERLLRRSSFKKFKKVFKKAKKQARNPEFLSETDKLGIPKCPKCEAPLLSGFGDSSGDYYQCLSCGAVIPVDFENGNK